VRLDSGCREDDERSVTASFDLNRNVSLVAARIDAIAHGTNAICGFEEIIDFTGYERGESKTAGTLRTGGRKPVVSGSPLWKRKACCRYGRQ
jgi:hypothetical protein